MPNSTHPDTWQTYAWLIDHDPDDRGLVEPPAWLLDKVSAAGGMEAPRQEAFEIPAMNGLSGKVGEKFRNTYLTQMAGKMIHAGFSPEAVHAALILDNPKLCDPPLPEPEIDHIYRSSRSWKKSPHLVVPPQGAPLEWDGKPALDPKGDAGPSAPWRSALTKDKKTGYAHPNLYNITHILAHHPYWQQPEHALWFDTIRNQKMSGAEPITEDVAVQVARRFGETDIQCFITNSRQFMKCLESAASLAPRDVLQDLLALLPAWDGVERLEYWLGDICQLEQSPYVMHLSKRLITSLVARALSPGCIYREVVIFEGPEKQGKSELCRALVLEKAWRADMDMSLEGKDAHIFVQRYWCVEFAELHTLSTTRWSRLKSFITAVTDDYVPKFSNATDQKARRTIFVGTTNEPIELEPGENTRFLPLAVPGGIDVDAFKANRTQIYAEALAYFGAHPDDWWHIPDEVEDEAKRLRKDREKAPVYQELIRVWLEVRLQPEWRDRLNRMVPFERGITTLAEIAEYCLELPKGQWTEPRMLADVGKAMRALGYTSKVARYKGAPTRVWTL